MKWIKFAKGKNCRIIKKEEIFKLLPLIRDILKIILLATFVILVTKKVQMTLQIGLNFQWDDSFLSIHMIYIQYII